MAPPNTPPDTGVLPPRYVEYTRLLDVLSPGFNTVKKKLFVGGVGQAPFAWPGQV